MTETIFDESGHSAGFGATLDPTSPAGIRAAPTAAETVVVPRDPTGYEVDAVAAVFWSDFHARYGGDWKDVDPETVAAIQTRATAKAAAIAMLDAAPAPVNAAEAVACWTVNADESEGRTYLWLNRHDGTSAALSCRTATDNGETIASQVAKQFAADFRSAIAAPPELQTEVDRFDFTAHGQKVDLARALRAAEQRVKVLEEALERIALPCVPDPFWSGQQVARFHANSLADAGSIARAALGDKGAK